MTVEQIAEKFNGRAAGQGRWKGKCPSHNGRTFTSLSIASGENGRTLVHCFGGCDTASILAAVGLSFSDLFEHQNTPRPPASAELRSVQKVLADLWPRMSPRERAFAEPVVIRTSAKNLNFAIAEALAMAVEGEIVQIAMIEGNT